MIGRIVVGVYILETEYYEDFSLGHSPKKRRKHEHSNIETGSHSKSKRASFVFCSFSTVYQIFQYKLEILHFSNNV